MDRPRTLLRLASSPLAAFRRAWVARRPYQTVSWVIGAALILSGLFHLGVFLVDGGAWEGPISWRKPVTFGLSFGITAVTLAWIAGLLRYRRYLAAAAMAVSIGSLLEVALVTMQKWRGVPSHFNDASPFDAAVFALMGLTVAVIAAGILVITIAAIRPFDAGPAMVVAVRVGLVVLIAAQALGGAIIANGISIDRPPTETDLAIFGAAGIMKLPHAVTMHAVQVLPVLALLLAATSLSARRQRNLMWLASAGYLGLAVATALQTYQGRAPFDLAPVTGGILLLSVALGVALFGLLAGSFVAKPGDSAV
jgi:hypothetical protein